MLKDKIIYRMSEAGSCPKALVAERLKYDSRPEPSWLETAAREGRRHEKWIKEDLVAEGYEVEDCEVCPICWQRYGEERHGLHVELKQDNFILIGHTDGRVKKDGHESGLEIKSMSQFEFDRWMKEGFSGFLEYAGQITTYMEADPHEDWLYIVKNRSSGYTIKGILTEPPASMAKIYDRFDIITEFIERGVLAEAEYDGNSIQCKRCFFNQLCLPVLRAITPVEEAKLTSAVKNWRMGKKLEGEGKQLIKEAQSVFETHCLATGMDRWCYNELTVTYVHVKESVAYPKEKLLATFSTEQLKPASVIKTPYDYVLVKDLQREQNEETGNAEMSE